MGLDRRWPATNHQPVAFGGNGRGHIELRRARMHPTEAEPEPDERTERQAITKILIRRLDTTETTVCSNSTGN
ncbi:hypothetical protein GCM10023194_22860 [Planotetraspora phitsanulokensis]|uniref:Uncharacterized protein n=1 Tax=Planotetraspora phitsanulokensis TaxID=575192 RepID=A0A8J3XJ93_9ACTN|nr:hypothetical protein Pph01_33460 [Planotetraspora phitsanulokensis]